MNREWITLTFGVLLVFAVVAVSVRNNVPWLNRDSAPPPAATTPGGEPAAEPAPTPAPPKTEAPLPPPEPVRVDASMAAVHKHRLGSCQGTLRVTSAGLAYATADRDDAFRLPFGEIDEFQLDREGDNLRVRQRGGRTWNFGSPTESTAALAAFHRQAERARRMAAR
jgi:hypothetical protein